DIGHGSATVDNGGGFWALRHVQFWSVWRDCPPYSYMAAGMAGFCLSAIDKTTLI
ncbi:hypothetical protein A2U01_0110324, partial [Trifolium medium]|nr:hypothetical protein [Trifolium medium]